MLLLGNSVEMFAHLEKEYVVKRASAAKRMNAAVRAHVVKPASAENTSFTL